MIQKEERLLRVGILGCGPIAQFAHFEACQKARNIELYATCDSASDLLQEMARRYPHRVSYGEYESMLADPGVEAVIVAVADQFHVPLCKQALDAGKHVLVEKPLGIDVEDCEDLVDKVRHTGRVLQVGNNRRFDPGVQFAHRFIQSEMGQRMAYKGWYCDSTRRYTMTDNLQPAPIHSSHAKRPEGDPKANKRRYFLLAHGSHLVDMAEYIGGDIVAVEAKLVERFNAYCWFVAVDFADGSVGHLDLTVPLRGDFQEGFTVYGEWGSVTCKMPLTWYRKSSEVECYSDKDGMYRRMLGEDAFTYRLQLESFADTILKGSNQVGATAVEGSSAVRLLTAITRSVETGKSVAVADIIR